jgi:hypothetical protein
MFFGPPGSASGTVSPKYGSGSGSFHHKAKKSKKNLDFYSFVNFWPPGSASKSVGQRYGSEDPDPHPYQVLGTLTLDSRNDKFSTKFGISYKKQFLRNIAKLISRRNIVFA